MTLDVSTMTGPKWGPPLHHGYQSSGRRELVFTFLWTRTRRTLGAAEHARAFRPDARSTPSAVRSGVYQRVYCLGALQCARPDAWNNRPRRWRARGLPGGIHPLEPRWEPSSALCARRVQLPRVRSTGTQACGWCRPLCALTLTRRTSRFDNGDLPTGRGGPRCSSDPTSAVSF